MGRKQRRGTNRQKGGGDDGEDQDPVEGQDDMNAGATPAPATATAAFASSSSAATSSASPYSRDLDFAERREVQRRAAAEKRRAKMKCYLCGQAGHVRRECPGIRDDGRGMSRYKGKSNAKHEREKYQAGKRRQEGSGSYASEEGGDASENEPPVDYPEGFECGDGDGDDLVDFLYYDVSCDVAASLEYVREGRGNKKKKRLSQGEAVREYRRALECADSRTNFGGMISRTLLRPNRPWIRPEQSPLPEKTWYVVGLSRDFLLHNDSKWTRRWRH